MAIVLGIYVGAMIMSRLVIALCDNAYNEKMKIQGYVYTTPKKGTYEKVIDEIQLDFCLLIPFINIGAPLYYLFNFDKLYKEGISEDLKTGKIEKREEPILEETSNKEESCTTQNLPSITDKPYSEMDNQEKLRYLNKILRKVQEERDYIQKTEQISEGKGPYIKK